MLVFDLQAPGLRRWCARNKEQTAREKHLDEMEAVLSWTFLLVLIKPQYSEVRRKGAQPWMPMESPHRSG